MRRFKLFLTLLVTLLMASCSVSDDVVTGRFIQKRKYTKGFYLNTRGKAKKSQLVDKKVAENKAAIPLKDNRDYTKVMAFEVNNSLQQLSNAPNNLIASNSEKLNESTVIPRINLKSADYTTIAQISKKSEIKFQKKVERKVQRLQKKKSSASGSSQLIALVLVFFVGLLGVHRMYLGYYLIGIIQLFTLGGCGIWALVDFIRILLGDLKPNGGEYTETLDDL